MQQRYSLAHDCPTCGLKDEDRAWSGARMSSSAWGHYFSCCSDECGFALAEKIKGKEDTKAGRKFLRELWAKCASQSDSRLSGEPYPGYPWRK